MFILSLLTLSTSSSILLSLPVLSLHFHTSILEHYGSTPQIFKAFSISTLIIQIGVKLNHAGGNLEFFLLPINSVEQLVKGLLT